MVLEQKKQEISELRQPRESDVEVKIALKDKIIEERRIKRYYKAKYEVNFQDELDPEDDQQQIYDFYREAFAVQPQLQEKRYEGEEHLAPATSRLGTNRLIA